MFGMREKLMDNSLICHMQSQAEK